MRQLVEWEEEREEHHEGELVGILVACSGHIFSANYSEVVRCTVARITNTKKGRENTLYW